ncbi:unnamed protein product, partial [Heterobilharzia americana]
MLLINLVSCINNGSDNTEKRCKNAVGKHQCGAIGCVIKENAEIGLLTTTICEDADLFDKRATLSYFKRDGELTDSSSEPSSSSKRASLSYFKRGQNEYWQTSPHHLRRIAEICPCLRKDYLEWL